MLSVARILLVGSVLLHWGLGTFGDRLQDFWLGAGIHGLGTLAWVYLCVRVVRGTWQPTFLDAFGMALLMRMLALLLDPALSDDIYRYLHEGHMVLRGENPYLTAPAAVLGDLKLATFGQINHPHVPAAYPPVVQYLLALGFQLDETPFGMKLVFGACDLFVFVVLWKWLPLVGRTPARAIVYGLCPLAVLEFAGEGHSDSVAVLLVVSTLWLVALGRAHIGGATLALAVASKLLPIVALPFVARRDRWAYATFGVLLAVVYLPFAVDAIARDRPLLDLFAGTLQYGDSWRHNDSVFAILHWASDAAMQALNGWAGETLSWSYWPHRVAKVPIALLGVGLLWMAWRRRWPLHQVLGVFFFYFVACTPTLHPWYVALLLPFLCLAPTVGFLLFTGTVYIAHSVPGRDHVEVWMKAIEYAPLYLGLFWVRAAARRPED